MTEPRPFLSEAELARELEAIKLRLAAMAASDDPARIAEDLRLIRLQLHDLAEANAEVKKGGPTGEEGAAL